MRKGQLRTRALGHYPAKPSAGVWCHLYVYDEAELARSAQVGEEWEAAFRMRRLAHEASMTL